LLRNDITHHDAIGGTPGGTQTQINARKLRGAHKLIKREPAKYGVICR